MSSIKNYIEQMPKAENHFHIDCISADLTWKFAKRNHIELPYASLDEARLAFQKASTSLDTFFNISLMAINTIKTDEDFSDMVIDCARDMKRQNIIYREAMFDYTICYGVRGIPLKTMINGFANGLKTAKKEYGADIRFIANLDRSADVESNCDYLQTLQKYQESLPIVAVGFDMKEAGFPASRQKKALLMARKMGFLITGHAGEESGPESIWDFLRTCEVDRIDHGVRAAEDEKLARYLSERKLLLTLCPDSNLCLGVYKKWEDYPLPALMKHGVIVSINSDDPPYFNYDLTGNLIKVAEQFNLSEDDIAACVTNALAYNFAGREHLSEIQEWLRVYKQKGVAIHEPE